MEKLLRLSRCIAITWVVETEPADFHFEIEVIFEETDTLELYDGMVDGRKSWGK